jgi:hypothetical protein
MRRALTVLAGLITMGTAANATTLAAGGIFGGTTQNLANCVLYNAGDSNVSVLDILIASTFVGRVPTSFNNCLGVLHPGAICNVQANIKNDASHACKVVFSPNGAAVRGVLVISSAANISSQTTGRNDSAITVLQNVELR